MTEREKIGITIRLAPDEYKALSIVAEQQMRSLNNQIIMALRRDDDWQKELERLRSAQPVAQQAS